MKMKSKTAYKITFWGFAAITIACYVWTAISVVRGIIHLIQ